MYSIRPKNPHISFSILGDGISYIALIFEGSTSITRRLMICPSNFL